VRERCERHVGDEATRRFAQCDPNFEATALQLRDHPRRLDCLNRTRHGKHDSSAGSRTRVHFPRRLSDAGFCDRPGASEDTEQIVEHLLVERLLRELADMCDDFVSRSRLCKEREHGVRYLTGIAFELDAASVD
jgi:hypothetical protein